MRRITSTHCLLPSFLFAAIFFTSCSQLYQASTVYTPQTQKASSRFASVFDFVPGANVLWHETFATTPVGDFPKGWNTAAGAEVVEEKSSGRALLLTKDGVYIPTAVNLPRDFTLQFTLSCSAAYSYYSSPLQIMFASLSTKKEFAVLKQYNPHNKDVVKLTLHPMNAASNAGASTIELIRKGTKQSENEIGTPGVFCFGRPGYSEGFHLAAGRTSSGLPEQRKNPGPAASFQRRHGL